MEIRSPEDAKRLGVGMVHQHSKLVEAFDAADNITIGTEKGALFLKKDRYKEIQEIADCFGFRIDLRKKVHNMSVSEKQTLEIMKVLYYGAKIIILSDRPDFPTVTRDAGESIARIPSLLAVAAVNKRPDAAPLVVSRKQVKTMRDGKVHVDKKELDALKDME